MSTLRLSSAEIKDLAHVQALLLESALHVSFESYLKRSSHAIQALLKASTYVYSYPEGRHLQHAIPDLTTTLRGVYSELIADIQQRFDMFTRHKRLGIWSRRKVYGARLSLYQSTAYYNEFVIPLRGHDATGLTLSTHELPYVTHILPTPYLLSADEEARRLSLLRVLYPAFRAGTLNMHRAQRALQDQARLIDALPVAAALFGTSPPRLLHQSTTLGHLLAQTKQPDRLTTAIAAAARQAAMTDTLDQSGAARTIVLDVGVYELTTSWVRAGALVSSPCLLVVAHPRGLRLPSTETLRKTWGLTRREAEVALLVCRQLSNRAIAEHLKLSRHTVRHHVSHILAKLAVLSRDEVPNILINPGMTERRTRLN